MRLRPTNGDEKHVGGCGVGDLVARLPLAAGQMAGDKIACPTGFFSGAVPIWAALRRATLRLLGVGGGADA
ncbi:MAG TPA: hypothetical protein VGG72_24500 [Bryobacteraceae bacterium]